MTTQAPFSLRGRNPDILSCIASLSNDEVFTPPEFANRMLDTVAEAWAADNDGANIWANSSVTFLDPCTKSGVFLREITSRLTEGLATEMPDLQTRVNHILTKQVFGIGITRLTSLMARRSVYCSKHAQGSHSIASAFATDDGNIWYERMEHTWVNGRCKYCGAGTSTLDRGDDRENYAYAFIHTDNIKSRIAEMFGANMQFDVIIGNPPYQMSDGGFGASASPIYQLFVEQAIMLEPKYLTMVIPSRWYGGGKGLSDFRATMLSNRQLRQLVDYENATDAFPGVDIAGGICYFLWSRDTEGDCEVTNVAGGEVLDVSLRRLDEFPSFVRHREAVSIIRKVRAKGEETLSRQVSSRKPFGLATDVKPLATGDLGLRWRGGKGFYKTESLTVGIEMIDKWKVITSRAAYDHAGNPGKDGRRRVLSTLEILEPFSICSETYLVVGSYDSELEARNLMEYMKTRFFRFLLSQFMYSHDLTRSAYEFVPVLDMTVKWTDEMLAGRYGLVDHEIEFIKSKIRSYDREADAND